MTLIIGAWRIAEVCADTKSVAAKIGPNVSTTNAGGAAGDVVETSPHLSIGKGES
jgi:hypothetical protein